MPEVDYDKLAQEAGGVDYDAIASAVQAGEPRPGKVAPSLWQRFKTAAYDSSPLPLFERKNLPLTVGALTAAATGGASIPAAMAVGGMGAGAAELGAQAVEGKGQTPPDFGAAAKQAALGAGAEATAVVGPVMKKAAPWLMSKAVKPTQTVLNEFRTTAPEIAKTLLDEGVNVTRSGLEQLQRLFKSTNDEIASSLQARDALLERLGIGAPVDKKRVAARVATTAKKMEQQVNAKKDLGSIGQTVENFLEHPTMGSRNMTLQEAQAMKVGTYNQIGKKYGQLSSAEVEAEKALARGLKEEIEAEAPQIAGLNARDAKLMAAIESVGQRVALSERADPVGFAWAAHSPQTFLAALIDRNPAVKSMLARGMYRSAAAAAKVNPQTVRAALVAIAQQQSPAPDDEPPSQ